MKTLLRPSLRAALAILGAAAGASAAETLGFFRGSRALNAGNGQGGGNGHAHGKLVPAPPGTQIQGSYILTFEGDLSEDEIAGLTEDALEKVGGKGKLKAKGGIARLINAAMVDMTEEEAVAVADLPGVKSVTEDALAHAWQVPTDATWGIDRIDQRNGALNGAYEPGFPNMGKNSVVYVIDTGIRTTHDEFENRAYNPPGYDYMGNDANGNVDCNGHGTHCAGTVGGKTYGVAQEATLVGVRVLGCTGSGSYTGVINGIDRVATDCPGGVAKADLAWAGKRCVASMSLGGGAYQPVDDAVNLLHDSGTLVAVAAGNDSSDASNYSPARADKAFTVGSTTSSDAMSSFSNYGPKINIFAPGSSITSAWYQSDTQTNTISGTSMAAPHVAGVAALFLDVDPTLTADEVATKLADDATQGVLSGVPSLTFSGLLFAEFATCTDNSQCVSADPCKNLMCNTTSGQCYESSYNVGDVCDDGDDSECTVGQCVAGGSCVTTNVAETTPCADSENGDDVCTSRNEAKCDGEGTCVAPSSSFEGAICDRGSCYTGATCQAGVCSGGDVQCIDQSLETTMDGGNGQCGNMFDITADSEDITITSLDIHCDTITTYDVHVWHKTGTHVGSENTSGDWTRATPTEGVLVPCLGIGQHSVMPEDTLNIPIAAGSRHALYVTLEGTLSNIDYTNGITVGASFKNDDFITFYEGTGNVCNFGSIFAPRVWNGQIHYSIASASSPTTNGPTQNPTTAKPVTAGPTSPPSPAPTGNPTSPPTTPPPVTSSPTSPPSPAPTGNPTSVAPAAMYLCGKGATDEMICKDGDAAGEGFFSTFCDTEGVETNCADKGAKCQWAYNCGSTPTPPAPSPGTSEPTQPPAGGCSPTNCAACGQNGKNVCRAAGCNWLGANVCAPFE